MCSKMQNVSALQTTVSVSQRINNKKVSFPYLSATETWDSVGVTQNFHPFSIQDRENFLFV